MPYAGLLTLLVVAVLGILLGTWVQRREEGAEGVGGGPEGAEVVVADEGGPVGGTETVSGLDPRLVAVIAAAVAAASETGVSRVWVRPAGGIDPWVLSGRQELHNAVPLNLRWRAER